jgi:hypothetical protein
VAKEEPAGAVGTVTIPSPEISTSVLTEGEAFEHVLERFKEENKGASPEQLRQTAIEVVGKCVGAYTAVFGSGEVGPGGSGGTSGVGRAGGPISDGTTGLIYGRIQSGKTITAIATTALAAENGFRLAIVLTSDNVWLGRQTHARFRDELQEGGPGVREWIAWSDDPKEFGSTDVDHLLGLHGAVLVSTKNIHHLAELLAVLKAARGYEYPALIIDDEADNASLNTQTAKQAREGKQSTVDSKVYAAIGEIRKALPHHIYLQVTATPQSLLLQKLNARCRPTFCVLSKTGQDYMGSELFFSAGSQLWVCVDEDELDALRGGAPVGKALQIPKGLRQALCCFFVGSCFKLLEHAAGDPGIYSMLIHIDHRHFVHKHLEQIIRRFMRDLDAALNESPSGRKYLQAHGWIEEAYQSLRTTAPTMPPLAQILSSLKARIHNAVPEIINATNPNDEPQYRPGMNILIGGNRLGRGITIKGLFITYYGRDAQVKMTDTVLQHARMFGYRQSLKDVTRLFVPKRIYLDFQRIHESDEGMRNAIGNDPSGKTDVTPVWVGSELKPTRANVLDPSVIGAFAPGVAIFPPDPMWKSSQIKPQTAVLDRLLAPYQGDDSTFHRVEIDKLAEIVRHMPSVPRSGYTWEDTRVKKALEQVKLPPWNLTEGYLNLRTRNSKGLGLKRQDPPWHGFASGDWLAEAKRKADAPVLMVMYQRGDRSDRWDNQPVYLPTLIMPASKFVIMFAYR